jgi:hypothetical protein
MTSPPQVPRNASRWSRKGGGIRASLTPDDPLAEKR